GAVRFSGPTEESDGIRGRCLGSSGRFAVSLSGCRSERQDAERGVAGGHSCQSGGPVGCHSETLHRGVAFADYSRGSHGSVRVAPVVGLAIAGLAAVVAGQPDGLRSVVALPRASAIETLAIGNVLPHRLSPNEHWLLPRAGNLARQ